MEHKPLVMERTYDAPVQKVWQALTDPAKIKQWFLDVKMFNPKVGAEFSLAAVTNTKWNASIFAP